MRADANANANEASTRDARWGSWTTRNEIAFIRGLGTWASTSTERSELLENYRRSTRKRVRWENLDKNEIMDELDVLQGVKRNRARWRKIK